MPDSILFVAEYLLLLIEFMLIKSELNPLEFRYPVEMLKLFKRFWYNLNLHNQLVICS